MNEQEKRELMLRFAVENGGEWPDDSATTAITTSEKWDGHKELVGYISLCVEASGDWKHIGGRLNGLYSGGEGWAIAFTRTEYEAFIDSLFEDAPEVATHYGNNCYFMKSGKKWWSIGVNDRVWQKCFGGLDVSKLIPRPRKQETKIDVDSLHDASVDGIKIAIEDDAVPNFLPVVEWNGGGLPATGVKCEFSCTARGKECSNAVGTVEYMSKYTCVMRIEDSEFVAHPDTMTFRPLKTEAEKEREDLASRVCGIVYGFIDDGNAKTCLDIANALLDADMIKRPKK